VESKAQQTAFTAGDDQALDIKKRCGQNGAILNDLNGASLADYEQAA
jgi:hypothetical protein